MSNRAKKEVLWVVAHLDLIQGDLDPDDPRRVVTPREALPTPGEAEADADRLNDLNSSKNIRYSAAPVRFYPEGRHVEIGY